MKSPVRNRHPVREGRDLAPVERSPRFRPVTTATSPIDRVEEMAAVSRIAAAAILLTCFLFGMLLAMTGVRRPGKAALPSPDENNRLRGANDVGVRSQVSL